MNILVFSHSSGLGGAQKALIDLIRLLIRDHQVSVMLPSLRGAFFDELKSMGVKCGLFPSHPSLPNPASTLLEYSNGKIDSLSSQLKNLDCDLIVANTITALPNILIAKELNIPCITYAHEYLSGEKDMIPHGCSSDFYLKLINTFSNHILCASEYVKKSFIDRNKCSVLYPFAPYPEFNNNQEIELNSAPISLLVIGVQSITRNAHFAITVLKALRLRGINLHLHFIGSENTGTYKLKQQMLIRGEKNIFLHAHLLDPYSIPGKKINLVCARSEAFGLTVPESLARGIPVIASRCGGPEEILSGEFLYDFNNIDECVRSIERVVFDYKKYSNLALQLYSTIAEKNSAIARMSTVKNSIESAFYEHQNPAKKDTFLNLDSFKKILNPVISVDQIIKNISDISKNSSHPRSCIEIQNLIDEEKGYPGSSIMKDILEFDVVPFGSSENMNILYKSGLGLSIELLANIKNSARQNMIAYILLRLSELRTSNPSPRILCIGDALGIDSIILASCDFDIDHIDLEGSLINKCTELNIKTAVNNVNEKLNIQVVSEPKAPYDAIIALEFIEHISNPKSFFGYLSKNLIPGGLLFISESFDGILDRTPTHLYSNEELASTLPVLAAPFFNLEDVNTLPFGKPYLFTKNMSDNISGDTFNFFTNPLFINSLVVSRGKIGF